MQNNASESDVYNQPVEYWCNDTVYAKIVDFASKTPSTISSPYFYDARNIMTLGLVYHDQII
ncbi:MAG: hypothetical protein U0L12_07470 [Ruminococcus sp.]|nr:hypothetical protein [Ruminococcus sp.]